MGFHNLYIVTCGFFTGVLLQTLFHTSTSVILFLLLIFSALLLYLWFTKVSSRAKSFFIFLFLFSVSLGALRCELSSVNGNRLSDELLGKTVVAEGVITDLPDVRENNTRLTLTLQNIASSTVRTKILAIVPRYQQFHYGDTVRFKGVISEPENFSGENGRTFDYVSYLEKSGIYYLSKSASVEVLSHGAGNFFLTLLFSLRGRFEKKINDLLLPPESSFLAGILIAGKATLSKAMQDEFVRAGAIQIVVLSGYNITVVANAIMAVLSGLPRSLGLSFGALSVIAFVLMTGGSATVVRAGIMALIALSAKALGRRFDALRALLIAAFLMVIQNPKILAFDPSFQLSFLATLGLIVFTPVLWNRFTFVTEKYKLRETVASTVATQIFVLPYILWQIGTLSVVSVFVNAIIMPFIPLTMFLGFWMTLCGFISVVLAFPLTFITHILVFCELWVVHIFASLPFAAFSIPYFPFILVLLVYAIYGYIIWKFYSKKLPA